MTHWSKADTRTLIRVRMDWITAGEMLKIQSSPVVFRSAAQEQRQEERPPPSASLLGESTSPSPASLQL